MASYLIKAENTKGNKLDIMPGMVEAGEIGGNTTQVRLMQIPEFNNSKHDFNVRLHIISGSADL